MSQWTHFLGIIRFDSMSKNVWPEPRNASDTIGREADTLYRMFHYGNVPRGSEGPIEINTIVTDRGPTVIITGDLRDYGKENLVDIPPWLNEVIKDQQINSLLLRDAFIKCNVEYDNKLYIVEPENKTGLFELNAYDPIRIKYI